MKITWIKFDRQELSDIDTISYKWANKMFVTFIIKKKEGKKGEGGREEGRKEGRGEEGNEGREGRREKERRKDSKIDG